MAKKDFTLLYFQTERIVVGRLPTKNDEGYDLTLTEEKTNSRC